LFLYFRKYRALLHHHSQIPNHHSLLQQQYRRDFIKFNCLLKLVYVRWHIKKLHVYQRLLQHLYDTLIFTNLTKDTWEIDELELQQTAATIKIERYEQHLILFQEGYGSRFSYGRDEAI